MTLEKLMSFWRSFTVHWYGRVDFSVRTLLHVWFTRRGLNTPDYYLAEEPWNFYRRLVEVLGDTFKASMVVRSLASALAGMGCKTPPEELEGALKDIEAWKRLASSLAMCVRALGAPRPT